MSKLFWIGGFLLVLGVILVVIGFKEKGLAAAASATPEEISLQALIARGPDSNPNIILKDFVLCENYVFRTRNGIWESAWVPAVPQQGANPLGGRPPVVQALIFTINARSQADLYQRCGQQRLRALVTNRIVSLGGKERDLLAQSYPGTDLSRCLIIQEGREPAGPAKLVFMIGGGGLSCLVGLGLVGTGFCLWQKDRSAPPRKRRRDEDDDEEDEDDRPAARRRRTREDDDDDRPRKRSRPVAEDEGDYEQERPRRRPRRDDDEDRPRKRQADAEDEDASPRRRLRDDDNDRPRKRRPTRDGDDD
jgi:hypothetical protein